MSKRPTGLGKGKGQRVTSKKTKKRLAIKVAMLATRKKPQKKKSAKRR
jgi:hypothetical protein